MKRSPVILICLPFFLSICAAILWARGPFAPNIRRPLASGSASRTAPLRPAKSSPSPLAGFEATLRAFT